MNSAPAQPFLASLASDPVLLGQVIGYGFVFFLILWGIIKCVILMRKVETSAACVAALLCFLVAWLTSSIVTVLRNHADAPMWVQLIGTFVSLVSCIGGVITGIVGLILYDKKNDPPYRQGRAQAIWGMTLNGLIVLTMVGGFFWALIQRGQLQAQAGSEFDSDRTGRQSTPPMGERSPGGGGDEQRNEEMNFRFDMPESSWSSMNPSLVNPIASLCLASNRERKMFMVIAERGGIDIDLTTEGLAEIARANLASVARVVEFSEARAERVNNLDYLVFTSRVRGVMKQNDEFRYEHWVTNHNGFYYQLVTYTTRGSDSEEEVGRVAREMAGRFHQIDSELVIYSAGGKPSQPTRIPSEGFDVDLSKLGWNEWLTADRDFPEAQFTAIKGAEKVLGVVALDLAETRPDLEELTAGYLAAVFGLEFPSQFGAPEPFRQGDAEGYRIYYTGREGGDSYHYEFRVLSQGGRAWFLAAWMDERVGDPAELTEGLDAVTLYSPPEDDVTNIVVWPDSVVAGSAEVMNQIGLSYYRKGSYAASIPYFRIAADRDTTKPIYIANLLDGYLRTGDFETGIEIAQEGKEKFPGNSEILSYEGFLLSNAGRDDEAAVVLENTFSLGHANSDDLLGYLNILVDLERQEDGLRAIAAYREKVKAIPLATLTELVRWEASLLGQLERNDERIAILNNALEENRDHPALLLSLVEARLDNEEYSEAREMVEEMISGGYRGTDALMLKGRAELGLDWLPKAKASFEKAQEMNPETPEVGNYLEYVSAALGKGDNSDVQTPIEPVSQPEVVKKLADALLNEYGDHLSDEFGHQYLRQVTGMEFRKGEPLKTTTRTTVRLVTTAGVDSFSTLRFPFDSLSEEIYINEVVVRNAEGGEISRASVDDFYVLDSNDDSMATNERIVHVPVPGLESGQTLDYTVTTRNRGDDDLFSYQSIALVRAAPSTGRIVYVTGDTDAIKVETHGEVKIDRSAPNLVVAHSACPPAFAPEGMQPWTETFLPWLWMNDREQTWKRLGEDYLTSIEDRLTGDDKHIEDLAKKLIDGRESLTDKVFAISDHVQSKLTYQAIEFGKRARIPNAASDTLRNLYGDCKDHSVLLYRLLEAAGIDASLALASTNGLIREEMPSLDQFNHMVVHVPGLEKVSFVDATGKHFPVGLLPAESITHESALVLEPGDVRFISGGIPVADDNQIASTRSVAIDKNAEILVVTETVRFSGYAGAWMRRYLQSGDAARLRASLAGILEHHGRPTIIDMNIDALEKHDEPLVMDWTYRLRRHLRKTDPGHYRIRWPMVWESFFLRKHSPDVRKNPFEIVYPMRFTAEAILELPDDWVIDRAEETESSETGNPFVEWRYSRVVPTLGRVRQKVDVETRSGQFDANQFESMVTAMDGALAHWEREVAVREAPEPAPGE